jgi:hypothetical protein
MILESPIRGDADAALTGRWRTIVAVVLIVLGCVLAPLAGLLLVALALIEFLGQPPQPTVVAPSAPSSPPQTQK